MSTPKKKRFNPYLFSYHIEWLNNQLEDASTYLRQLIDRDIEQKKGKKYLAELQETKTK